MSDIYKTLAKPSDEKLFKEKNSKFWGVAFPIVKEEDVKIHLEQLRKKHIGAVHFCYAYQMGTDPIYYRANDDGEPAHSAGAPIYGQIQSFGITNVLVVVVRYFGGVKLGVGGLIQAYRTAAQLALASSEIVEKTIDIHFEIHFEYAQMNKVMRIIKEKKLSIVTQKMDSTCSIVVATRKKNAEEVSGIFKEYFEIKIAMLDTIF